MSVYRYEAIDRAGKMVSGAMNEQSEPVVAARLSQMGYRPVRIIAAQPAAGTSPRSPSPSTGAIPAARGGAPAKDLALFYRQFAALVRSGISLYQALDSLGPRTQNSALSAAAREMAEAARGGAQISTVMERHPRLFAPHVTASVRGGEKGGFLEIVLDEVALEYEQELAFYKGFWIAKATILQAMIAIAVAQPVFPHLFPEPHWGEFLRLVFLRNIPILILLLAAGKAFFYWLSLPKQNDLRDTWILRLPAFGDLARQRSLAAFVRMLRRLFAAGIGPLGAWEGAMNVAPNAVIRKRLNDAYGLMQHNLPLHEAFARTGLFANEAEQLLATGMVSGAMVDMLDRVADYYQANVDRAFDNSRWWMRRLASSLVIALSGLMIILLFRNYFASIFGWVDANFKDNG